MKKLSINRMLKKTPLENIFLFLFTLGFLFKYDYLALFIFHVPSITGLLVRNVIIVVVIYGIFLPFLHKRGARLTVLGILFLFTLFIISNLWYSRYFGNYLSLSDILMGRGMRPYKVLFRQIGRVYDILFFADLAALYLMHRKIQSDSRKVQEKIKTKRRLILTGGIVLLLMSMQMYTTNLLLGNDRPFILYNRSTAAFVNVYGFLPLYAYEYYMLYFTDTKKIKELDTPPPEQESDLTGKEIVEKDHNVIAIQIESLDKKVIDYSYNGREVTPFLNKLKERALYFDKFYAQHVNGSFDAEFSFLTSIYPINKNYGFKVNDLSRFESLVKILNKQGYTSVAFHGNDKSFFHRSKAFPELGFHRFYSREDFSFKDRVMLVKESSFGINDYDFLLQSFDVIEKTAQPFFAFLITVTSHTPFDFYHPDQAVEEFEEISDPLVRDYFNSISFVDSSLEMFFKKINEAGLDENTLIIIYSDHESWVDKQEYSSNGNFILQTNVKPPEHIPLFIIHPDVKVGTIEKEGSTTDLAPTILDICGNEKNPEEFLGVSLLGEETSPVLFIHEIPQILYKGQLFASFPTGIEKIGFEKKVGEKNIELPNEEELLGIIDYMRSIILRRRDQQ